MNLVGLYIGMVVSPPAAAALRPRQPTMCAARFDASAVLIQAATTRDADPKEVIQALDKCGGLGKRMAAADLGGEWELVFSTAAAKFAPFINGYMPNREIIEWNLREQRLDLEIETLPFLPSITVVGNGLEWDESLQTLTYTVGNKPAPSQWEILFYDSDAGVAAARSSVTGMNIIKRLRGGGSRSLLTRRTLACALSTAPVSVMGPHSSTVASDAAPAAAKAEVPVTDLVQVFGRLAGDECFGATAPPGSSCQLSIGRALQILGLDVSDGGQASLSEDEFVALLQKRHFRWPLKPWGTANSPKSNAKTAVMNKCAETAVFMSELTRNGLYDPRNPAGPLPTSMRPQLNARLEAEEIRETSARLIFRALAGGGSDKFSAAPVRALTAKDLKQTFLDLAGGEPLDYYSFQALVNHEARVVWPSTL